MYYDLAISPAGHLCIHPFQSMADNKTGIMDKSIMDAFSSSSAEGLFKLLTVRNYQAWTPSLYYWQKFASQYLNALCRQPVMISPPAISPPEPSELDVLMLNLPPILGAEYCNHEMLIELWAGLDTVIRKKMVAYTTGLNGFLEAELPHWHQVGKICFHLAENKQDPEYPFAFIATYAAAMGKNERIHYQPLSQALKEHTNDDNKQQLVKILNPIYEASKSCKWVEELINSRDIYYPLVWTPAEAYNLLTSVPELEKSGIIVRLPDWWKKRPRPQVKVSIGNTIQKSFSIDALLDFRLDVVLEDGALTQEELDEILASDSGLISLRGQWVEVDAEKLKEALSHWKGVQADFKKDGVSFIEGMRLLAGANKDLSADDSNMENDVEWAYVNAGEWIKDVLLKLREPSKINNQLPVNLLNATLRPYQLEGVQWLHFLTELGLGACLADDMGLGKTIQVISLLLIKKQNQRVLENPSILILPASLLSNWKDELQRFAPTLNAYYLHASEGIQKQILDVNVIKDQDIVITTYGMLLRQPWLLEQIWDLIILDEAQAIKNPSSKQTKLVKSLKGRAKISLTGTPIENRLGDLWSLFDFLCPGLLGTTTKFKKYLKQIDNSDAASYATLKKLVQPYILRRLKTDKKVINDLPDKTDLIVWCGLSKEQTKLYTHSVAELQKAIADSEGIKRRGLVLSFLMRFKQICNHPSQALNDGQYKKDNSGKFLRLLQICEEIAAKQEKVLVFTQFREMTEPLSELLSGVFNQPGLIIHGGTPVNQRKKKVDEFQRESGPPFFILSLKAAGTGLNLTAANHVIHFDRWWNPAVENQATDRAFRIGQKKNVLVHKLVCKGTIEEKIHAMISEKVKLATDILGEGAEALLTELDDKALMDLISLDIEKAQMLVENI